MVVQATNSLADRHPLQRLNSPSQGWSACLHVFGLASFAQSFYYLVAHPNPVNDSYGWHLQYLTIIGLSLAATTFVFGLLSDLASSSRLFAIKNAFSVASAPMEILISLLYWSLRTIDKRLVLPDWAPELPVSADLGFHAVPAIVLALDLLFFSPPYTIAVIPSIGLSSAIAVVYYFWVQQCYEHNGYWPYPIFDEVGPQGRLALFAGSAAVMTLSSLSLKWVYSVVNGREMDSRQKPKP